MKKITTLTVYQNWDEEFLAIQNAGLAHEKLRGSPYVSNYTFHKAIHDPAFVAVYQLGGSNVNETFYDTAITRFDDRAKNPPTVFFVEVDETTNKIEKILFQLDGKSLTAGDIEREYHRIIFNKNPQPGGGGGFFPGDGSGFGLFGLNCRPGPGS
jgi:hypothetical protein